VKVPVQIVDLSRGAIVDAEMFDDVTFDHFVQTQREWRPMVVEATRRMIARGVPPELQPTHWHWNWENKSVQLGQFGISFYGIEFAGQLQGLMKVDLAKYSARIPTQKGAELAYIDYLEAAPWNHREITLELGESRRFAAVGTNLYAAALRLSQQAGFEGRVGLHSLPHPQTEQFYQKTCKMIPLERDATKQNLLYFETTPQMAELFISEAKR
jgi:hypothetical protein